MKFRLRLFSVFLILGSLPALAQESAAWGVTTMEKPIVTEGLFAVGSELSGIASINGTACLLASNETRCAQIGYLKRDPWRLTAGREIYLIPPEGTAECDFEAVACDPKANIYYVMGSHAVAKKKGKPRKEQQVIFRVPADPTTGVPDHAKPGAAKAISLFPMLLQFPEVASAINKPLQKNGLNMEGLAWKAEQLWIGCRAPNLDGAAAIFSISAEAIFTQPVESWPKAKFHKVPLGRGIGVRDLAPLTDGFLILAGQSGSEASSEFPIPLNYDGDKAFTLFHWNPETPNGLQRIGNLPVLKGKAESMMVLDETDTSISIMVLYDGAYNGAPRAFTLTKPRM